MEANMEQEETPIEHEETPNGDLKKLRMVLHKIDPVIEKLSRSERIFRCYVCYVKFKLRIELAQHVRKHYRAQYFPCMYCPVVRAFRPALKLHQDTHKDDPVRYKCLRCQKMFYFYRKLEHHISMHHLRSRRYTKCPFCNQKILKGRNYSKHVKDHEELIDEANWCCYLCQSKFSVREELRSHVQSHILPHYFPCSYCSKIFMYKSTVQQHESTHVEPVAQCDQCPNNYKSDDLLTKHRKLSGHDLLVNCDECEQKFKTRAQLDLHKETGHSYKAIYESLMKAKANESISNKPNILRKRLTNFMCPTCGEQFKTEDDWFAHECSRNKFWCQKCCVWLRVNNSLENHNTLWHNECGKCERGFESYELLERHKCNVTLPLVDENEVDPDESDPTITDVIIIPTRYKQSMPEQLEPKIEPETLVEINPAPEIELVEPRTVPNYRCEQCPKHFEHKQNLIEHELTHNCTQCIEKYGKTYGPKAHLLIHVNEMPQVCSKCKQSFETQLQLLKHSCPQLIFPIPVPIKSDQPLTRLVSFEDIVIKVEKE